MGGFTRQRLAKVDQADFSSQHRGRPSDAVLFHNSDSSHPVFCFVDIELLSSPTETDRRGRDLHAKIPASGTLRAPDTLIRPARVLRLRGRA